MKRYLLLFACALVLTGCDSRGELQVATFNVANYPRHDLQRKKVPQALETLDVPIIAVQEVLDPKKFERDVQAELGNHWVLAASQYSRSPQKLAVLYDSTRATLMSTTDHLEPILHPRARPAFEARFEVDDDYVRVIVLHLKAGGKFYPIRAAQWWELLPVIENAVESGDHVAILGDFNATGFPDRATLFALSLWTGTYWVSRNVECSHYWSRDDECVTTPLDHALTTSPGSARAHGACASVGCDNSDRCPVWVDEVSDHCPVVFDLD